jgi:hypothetical protein
VVQLAKTDIKMAQVVIKAKQIRTQEAIIAQDHIEVRVVLLVGQEVHHHVHPDRVEVVVIRENDLDNEEANLHIRPYLFID